MIREIDGKNVLWQDEEDIRGRFCVQCGKTYSKKSKIMFAYFSHKNLIWWHEKHTR